MLIRENRIEETSAVWPRLNALLVQLRAVKIYKNAAPCIVDLLWVVTNLNSWRSSIRQGLAAKAEVQVVRVMQILAEAVVSVPDQDVLDGKAKGDVFWKQAICHRQYFLEKRT